MPSEPAKISVSPMRRFNLMLLGVAALVLFLMLRGIDWPNLMHSFLRGVRYWPLLLVPYGVTSFFWAASWSCLLTGKPGCPPLRRLFFLRLAGESLNQLTPTASLGGEPFKALRLHALGVAWHEATASLVIHKAMMVVSLVLYIVLSLALIPSALPGLPPQLAWFSYLGTLLLASAGLAFVVLQRRNPCSSTIGLLSRWGLCPAVLRARSADFAALDVSLARFYREHAGACLLALLCFFLGWVVHALEVSLIFWLLGHPIDFGLALCLDALSQLVAGLGFMIPVSLGVQDGGNILLSLGFNLGSTLGAGFSILRRFREAFWLLLGLVVVAREK
jgi:glycosyltransferase 2 family protein